MLTERRRLVLAVALLAALIALLSWCARLDEPGSGRPPATDDPADARNITVTLLVAADQIGLMSASVGVGRAHSEPDAAGVLRVRTLTSSGREVRRLALPDPLRRHVYAPPQTLAETEPHSTDRMTRATVTVFLPLDAGAGSIEVGWAGRPMQRFDLVTSLRTGCRDDRHPDCADWLARHR
jgi:hypothetical protein